MLLGVLIMRRIRISQLQRRAFASAMLVAMMQAEVPRFLHVPRSGIATCPWSSFVQKRISTELSALSYNASIGSNHDADSCIASAPVLPSTFVFEDQVRILLHCLSRVPRDTRVCRCLLGGPMKTFHPLMLAGDTLVSRVLL